MRIDHSNIILLLAFGTSLQSPDKNQNIIILCFGIEVPDKNILSVYEIKSFNNPFKFIGSILSVKNKIIYLIILASKSHTIVPVIHKHYCIEKIYLYECADIGPSSNNSPMLEKINGYYEDINEIFQQIVNDIMITTERSLRSNPSLDFFTILHTQRLENEFFVIRLLNGVSIDELIVIFHYDSPRHFHIDRRTTPTSEFTDVNECIRIINEQQQSHIFLIISGGMIPLEIQSCFHFPQIHAIYFFGTNFIKDSINKRKVRGFFNNQKDLSDQLYQDIAFYWESDTHTSRFDIFPTVEHTEKVISHLNYQQIAFLRWNLFIDMLTQVPLLNFKEQDLTEMCDTLFPNKSKEFADYVRQLREEADEIKKLY